MKAKNKGYRGECKVRDALRNAGIETYRIPLSGAADGFEGDLRIIYDGHDFKGEVKFHNTPPTKTLVNYKATSDILFICSPRKPTQVFMDLDVLLRMISSEGRGQEQNVEPSEEDQK